MRSIDHAAPKSEKEINPIVLTRAKIVSFHYFYGRYMGFSICSVAGNNKLPLLENERSWEKSVVLNLVISSTWNRYPTSLFPVNRLWFRFA